MKNQYISYQQQLMCLHLNHGFYDFYFVLVNCFWYFSNWILQSLVYSSFAFYLSEDDRTVGRNVQEAVVYVNQFRYNSAHCIDITVMCIYIYIYTINALIMDHINLNRHFTVPIFYSLHDVTEWPRRHVSSWSRCSFFFFNQTDYYSLHIRPSPDLVLVG